MKQEKNLLETHQDFLNSFLQVCKFGSNQEVFISWWALLVALFISLGGFAQNVGIGTSNPRAKLHVAGDLRIDSLRQISSSRVRKILTIDSSNGTVSYTPLDTLKGLLGSGGGISFSGLVFFSENAVQATTTTSTTPQTRVSVTLGPGTYIIWASCEFANNYWYSGTFGVLTDGVTRFGDSNPYANSWAPWGATKVATITTTTTFSLQWYVWSGSVGTIQNARITALKIQ